MTQIKWAAAVMATAITLGMGAVSTAKAGALPGPKYADDRVGAYRTDTYVVRFEEDESAVVVLRGDGDTDLDLYVYDVNGHLIASDTDGDAIAAVRWTPAWTGRFIIKVVNHGSVYNHYTLETN